jgi:hypothetical protein
MEKAMSAASKWLAAAAVVGMYAVGMAATSTPASAHGWHCAWIRGHYHPRACRRGRWWRGRRGRRRGRWGRWW